MSQAMKSEYGKGFGSGLLPPKTTTAQKSYRGETKDSSSMRMSTTLSNMKSIVQNASKTSTVMNKRNNS